MNLAGEGQSSTVQFDFTVDAEKKELIKLLQEAVTNGKRVKVSYTEGKLTGRCTTDSGYFINAAEYTEITTKHGSAHGESSK